MRRLVVVLRRAANGFGRSPGRLPRPGSCGSASSRRSLLCCWPSPRSPLGAWCIGSPIGWWARAIRWWTNSPSGCFCRWRLPRCRGRCATSRGAAGTCLRRLELPVEIGRTGSVLLNWAGTEMVCSEGHGVLYLRRLSGQLAGPGPLEQARRIVGESVPRRLTAESVRTKLSDVPSVERHRVSRVRASRLASASMDCAGRVGDAVWLRQERIARLQHYCAERRPRCIPR